MSGIRDFEYAGWQAAAPAYAATFSGATRPFADPLLDAVSAGPGVTLLDVACGPGGVSALAASRGAEAAGIDFSPQMIGHARAAHPALDFRVADVEQLPFADASFDAAMANFGLHHFENLPIAHSPRSRACCGRAGAFAYTKWVPQRDNPPYRAILDAIAAHGTIECRRCRRDRMPISRSRCMNRTVREAGFTLDAEA